jgi:hypothetical protein
LFSPLNGQLGYFAPPVSDPVPGQYYWRRCFNRAHEQVEMPYVIQFPARGASRAAVEEVLVDQAVANLDVDLPVARFSPSTKTLPNIDTWFWTANGVTQAASASAAGVTVTVSAVASSTEFEFLSSRGLESVDDGKRLRCAAGSAPAYDPTKSPGDQHSNCVWNFSPPTRTVPIDVTTTWTISWRSTSGAGATLGTVSRTAGFTLDVQEKKTVITRAG